jgi:hypothetical protein
MMRRLIQINRRPHRVNDPDYRASYLYGQVARFRRLIMTSRTGITRTSIITLCGMVLLCAAAAGCGNMANKTGSSGASNGGTSGNSMEGNGARGYDAQDKAIDREKAGDKWENGRQDRQQDRRQEQRQQKDDMGQSSGNSASTGTSGSSATRMDERMPGRTPGDTQISWRGTVLAIEPLSRQEQTGIGIGGPPGAAAVGGVVPGTGAAMGTVYRVTLRTEDGGSQVVLVETPPDYRIGDKVMYRNGLIQRQ